MQQFWEEAQPSLQLLSDRYGDVRLFQYRTYDASDVPPRSDYEDLHLVFKDHIVDSTALAIIAEYQLFEKIEESWIQDF